MRVRKLCFVNVPNSLEHTLRGGGACVSRRALLHSCFLETMATPLLVGTGVAAAAMGARALLLHGNKIKFKAPKFGRSKWVEGGFEPTMTRKEAAKILDVRENAARSLIKQKHRTIMILNHPDTGGSTYLASKVNEAKDLLLGRR